MEDRATQLYEIEQQALLAVRVVPGVAVVAGSDLRLRREYDGMVSIHCTLIAHPNVQLYDLGLAVQVALAACLQKAGLLVREVNVFIADIDDRRTALRPSNRPGLGFKHG